MHNGFPSLWVPIFVPVGGNNHKRGNMQAKNHNIIIKKLTSCFRNLKTHFNRGAEKRNLALQNLNSVFRKHDLAFGALAMMMVVACLFMSSDAFAEATDSKNLTLNLKNAYSIEVVLPELSSLELTPTSSGAFSSQNITIGVGTNNPSGYTLTMSSTSSNLTRSAAINGSTPTIPTLESAIAEANFPSNHWGYKRTTGTTIDTNYQPMVANSSIPLNVTDGPANASNSQNTVNFGVKLNNDTPSGTYNITLTFVVVTNEWSDPEPLYNKVEALALQKGGGSSVVTQSRSDLQAVITAANSGVYQYDSSVFGTASDVNNGYNIYYYRGILDSNLDGTDATYGSNGDGVTWPNYVKLGDTCWRIFRTTASGGVKIIYNGSYSGGTTANSCANALDNAQITTQAFGLKGNSAQSAWYYNINRVGYTFNNTKSLQDSTTSTPVGTVFGDNSNYTTTNTANSNIKNYIENTWFSTISAYESMFEPSAGYCNDRSPYSDEAGATALTSIPPYRTSSSGQTMYFGARTRLRQDNATNPVTLSCPRGTVDLYTTSSASDGNKQLAKPIALITADEAALSGSGFTASYGNASAQASNYNYNSFLRSGSFFWLLSPHDRLSGFAYGFYLSSHGAIGSDAVLSSRGVRPVVSISHETNVTGGTGTATDPWTVE